MPIKQVTCSICKQTVNKAQTYHVGGDDRACKTHEGVTAKKDALEAGKREKATREQRRDERRAEIHEAGGFWSNDPSLKCWVCMNPGIRQDEFFMKVLVEIEKMKKIHGAWNILDPRNAIRLAERCIFILPETQAAEAMKYVREEFKTMVQMVGFLAICGPCCRVARIEPLRRVDPKILIEASVFYTAFLEPMVSAVAGRELARDN